MVWTKFTDLERYHLVDIIVYYDRLKKKFSIDIRYTLVKWIKTSYLHDHKWSHSTLFTDFKDKIIHKRKHITFESAQWNQSYQGLWSNSAGKVATPSITTWVPSPGPTWWEEEIYFQKLSFDSHLHGSEAQYPNLFLWMCSSDTDSYSFWKIKCHCILIMGQLKHIPQRKKTTKWLFKKFEYHESKLRLRNHNRLKKTKKTWQILAIFMIWLNSMKE